MRHALTCLPILPVLVAGALAACDADVGAPETDAESSDQEIRGGRETFAEPAVGVLTNGTQKWCSATLVHPSVILLAGHCFTEGRTDLGFGDWRPPWMFQIQTSATESFTVPTARGWVKSRTVGANDLGLVRLGAPVPSEIAKPMPLATRWPAYGTRLAMYGFGCDRIGGMHGVKRVAELAYGLRWDLGWRSRSGCPGDSGGALVDLPARAQLGVISGHDAFGTDTFADVVGNGAELEAEIARLAD